MCVRTTRARALITLLWHLDSSRACLRRWVCTAQALTGSNSSVSHRVSRGQQLTARVRFVLILIDPPVCPVLCNSLHLALNLTHSVIFILFCGVFVLLRFFLSLCPSSKDIHRTYQLRLFLNWSIFLYTRFIQWVNSLKSVWEFYRSHLQAVDSEIWKVTETTRKHLAHFLLTHTKHTVLTQISGDRQTNATSK